METHYICTGGCRGVSAKPGMCEEKTCSHHGKPLERCDCADGEHEGRQKPKDDLGLGTLGESDEAGVE